MASVVDIANLALLRVGAESILSLDDATERARACKLAWPFVRQSVLRWHSWNPPTTRATLPALVAVPVWDWDAQFQIPADCLRVLEVDASEWVLEGRAILCDEGTSLNIRYIRDETDTTQYDSLLTELMAQKLALEICERVTNSHTKKAELEQEWLYLLAEGKRADGEEQSNLELEEDDWILARY